MDNAFKFVHDHGILLESEYPYTGKKGNCAKREGGFKISSFTDISNCKALLNGIQSRPISVAVDATNFNTYHSGVFHNCATKLNHGVLLVGTKGGDWIVKNSWGTTWGEKGYITLLGGSDSSKNTCGICNVASYPNK